MSAAIRQARSKDGTLVAGELVGAGIPVLLVHGTSSARGRWAPVLATMSERLQLCLMDRRGRGLSGDGAEHSLAAEVADVAALAREAGARVLIGHSFGAICALEAARDLPDLQAVVLYEPPVPVPPVAPDPVDAANIRRIGEQAAAGWSEEAVLTFMRDVLAMPAAQIEAARKSPGWGERVALAPTLSRELAAVRAYHFGAGRFTELTVPVLVLLGGESPQRYVDAAHLVADGLPNAHLGLLPGQRHTAITEAPDLFASKVMAFLDERLVSA
ncbi:alpha/beta fold hydrolase [Amorphus sp. 3PC139-8]|uniref:alpha/beta fold hydrolase n=1 Tax=Amorphus sp. 3PC139-8 TaxID=2735676 RepID=UPI00345CB1D5